MAPLSEKFGSLVVMALKAAFVGANKVRSPAVQIKTPYVISL